MGESPRIKLLKNGKYRFENWYLPIPQISKFTAIAKKFIHE
jgi:hypothetical protein